MKKTTAADQLQNADSTAVRRDADLAKERAKRLAAEAKYGEAARIINDLEAQVETLIAFQGKRAEIKYDKAKKSHGGECTAIIPLTDWHVEERVDAETVNGLNAYSPEIAAQRIKATFQKAVMLVDFASRLSPIRELVVPVLGDIISGYIHEELAESNYMSPTEACLFAQDHIHAGLQLLKRETKCAVIRVPTCQGNHGRTTAKMRVSTSWRNSYEWMLFSQMARQYANDPVIRWDVGKGYHNIQQIQGHTVRFHHGDAIRYNGGIGGITIGVNKKIGQWSKSLRADVDIFGHYHQHLVHYPGWVCCGALVGYGPFSLKIGAEYQRPTQTFIVMDRKQGVTMTLPVFVTD